MRVLVVGSGAREHALVLALAQDPAVTALACAPGNAGTAAVAEQRGLDVRDPAAVADCADRWDADLVVDRARGAAGRRRRRRRARPPGSSASGPPRPPPGSRARRPSPRTSWPRPGVPTAAAVIVDNPAHLDAALAGFTPPYVVKDDGLAAGKGVVVPPTSTPPGRTRGRCSTTGTRAARVLPRTDPRSRCSASVDGATVVPLLPAQDFKRVGDGDTGPNTGGMGAYAPLPWAPPGAGRRDRGPDRRPGRRRTGRRGAPRSRGLLYAGLALTAAGPHVIEFNCRFGDPETQAVLALLRTPLAGLLHATATGALATAATAGVVRRGRGHRRRRRRGLPRPASDRAT